MNMKRESERERDLDLDLMYFRAHDEIAARKESNTRYRELQA